MNERIKELAILSGIKLRTLSSGDTFILNHVSADELKTFAELVIKDCALTVQDFVDHRIPASEYPKRLKKNFEIES